MVTFASFSIINWFSSVGVRCSSSFAELFPVLGKWKKNFKGKNIETHGSLESIFLARKIYMIRCCKNKAYYRFMRKHSFRFAC